MSEEQADFESGAPPGDAQILRALQTHWGYNSFRPLQREAIDAVLTGRDSVVVLPTGGGKSLCYQVPAVLMDGLAVVVSPLISLMKDQVDGLTESGIPAAAASQARQRTNDRALGGVLPGGDTPKRGSAISSLPLSALWALNRVSSLR